MIEPYPSEIQAKIQQMVAELKESPPEALLAVIHAIHILAQQVRRPIFENLTSSEACEEADATWESVRGQISLRMFEHSQRVDPLQTRPEPYLRSVGILLGMIHDLPDEPLGAFPDSERALSSPSPEHPSPGQKAEQPDIDFS